MTCLLFVLSLVVAVVYGRGVYFAVQFHLSACNTYATPDMSGNKHVYLSRVLTGDYTTGNQSYIAPPQKAGTTGASYMSGNKHVYHSRVLTGDYMTRNQSYIAPPQKPGTTGAANRYDCVVDNTTTPSIFVIFSDTQAYPEYLIIFK